MISSRQRLQTTTATARSREARKPDIKSSQYPCGLFRRNCDITAIEICALAKRIPVNMSLWARELRSASKP